MTDQPHGDDVIFGGKGRVPMNSDAIRISTDCRYWAARLDLRAEQMDAEGFKVAVDSNRPVAQTLRFAAEAIEAADRVEITTCLPVCDACGWQGDPVPTLDEASRITRSHMTTCEEVRALLFKDPDRATKIEAAIDALIQTYDHGTVAEFDAARAALVTLTRVPAGTPPKPTLAADPDPDPDVLSLVQCQYDSVDFPRLAIEAIDSLDDRLRAVERACRWRPDQ